MVSEPTSFLREFTRARAEVVTERPFGFVARSMGRFPHSHDHNVAVVTSTPVDPAALLADVEAEFADVGYRRIETDDDDAALASVLTDAGYEREDQVVMTLVGAPDTDRPASTGVVELTLTERVEIADRVWQADFDERDPIVRRELAERAHTAVAAAACTFLGVVGPEGVEATCDLFVRGDTAQVEEVSTLTPYRGRGHASRLVRAACDRARADGSDRLVFLLAEAADWPRHLYARLGFEVTGHRVVWSRSVSDP